MPDITALHGVGIIHITMVVITDIHTIMVVVITEEITLTGTELEDHHTIMTDIILMVILLGGDPTLQQVMEFQIHLEIIHLDQEEVNLTTV